MPTLLPSRPRWLVIAAAGVIISSSTLAAVVAFGVTPPPRPLTDAADAVAHLDLTGLPPLSRYRARDGATLAYRAYPGESALVAVLIHGSAGQSPGMNAIAQGLIGLGLKRGETIAIVGANRPRLYWSITAAQVIGAVPVPVSRYRRDHRGDRMSSPGG